MKVLGIVWLGTRTERFSDMEDFLEHTMGLTSVKSAEGFREYTLPNADILELFAPGDPDSEHMTTGPVPGFLVSDIASATDELRAAGIEILGPAQRQGGYAWQHFRAPDGFVYELVEDSRRLGSVG